MPKGTITRIELRDLTEVHDEGTFVFDGAMFFKYGRASVKAHIFVSWRPEIGDGVAEIMVASVPLSGQLFEYVRSLLSVRARRYMARLALRSLQSARNQVGPSLFVTRVPPDSVRRYVASQRAGQTAPMRRGLARVPSRPGLRRVSTRASA